MTVITAASAVADPSPSRRQAGQPSRPDAAQRTVGYGHLQQLLRRLQRPPGQPRPHGRHGQGSAASLANRPVGRTSPSRRRLGLLAGLVCGGGLLGQDVGHCGQLPDVSMRPPAPPAADRRTVAWARRPSEPVRRLAGSAPRPVARCQQAGRLTYRGTLLSTLSALSAPSTSPGALTFAECRLGSATVRPFRVRESGGVAGTCIAARNQAGELERCRPAGDRCCPLRSGRLWPRCGPGGPELGRRVRSRSPGLMLRRCPRSEPPGIDRC
jgi:hypothetical protein